MILWVFNFLYLLVYNRISNRGFGDHYCKSQYKNVGKVENRNVGLM